MSASRIPGDITSVAGEIRALNFIVTFINGEASADNLLEIIYLSLSIRNATAIEIIKNGI